MKRLLILINIILVQMTSASELGVNLPANYNIEQGSIEELNLQKILCDKNLKGEIYTSWATEDISNETILRVFDAISGRDYMINLTTWNGEHNFEKILPITSFYNKAGFRADIILMPKYESSANFKAYRDGLRYYTIQQKNDSESFYPINCN